MNLDKYIWKKVRKYNKLQHKDLFQAGYLGYLKAMQNYDENSDASPLTYARDYINSEILQYILNNYSLVKMGTSKELKKLFYNVNKHLDLTDEAIAEKYKVKVGDVVTTKNRVNSRDLTITDSIDENSNPLDIVEKERLNKLILDKMKGKDLLFQKFYFNKSYEEIGEEYNLSGEAIRLRINKVLRDVKKSIEHL